MKTGGEKSWGAGDGQGTRGEERRDTESITEEPRGCGEPSADKDRAGLRFGARATEKQRIRNL